MTSALVITRTDVPESVAEMQQLGKMLLGTQMLPEHLRDDPGALFLTMLKARALDVPMSTAFDHVLVIEGRTGMSGALMQTLVLRAGFNLFPVELTREHATVRAERPGIGEGGCGYDVVTFTLEDAENAELITIEDGGKVRSRSKQGNKAKPWELYTKDMLYWRAISRAAKRYFTDVLLGVVHLPDEIGGDIGPDGRPIQRTTITVDVSEEVKGYLLRIGRCDSMDALRDLYNEIRDDNLLSALTVDGNTLSQVIAAKKRELKAAAKASPAPAPEGGDQDEPAPESDDDEHSEPVRGPGPASDFDSLEADAPDADPEQLRNTARRRGVIRLANEMFGNPDAAAREKFGRPLAEVGTNAMQEWLVAARKGVRA